MISVCMATYNGEKYLKEQIDSILVQLGQNDELIISDDMSTDRTIDIINDYNDSRIKFLLHKTNHGFVKNFENALKHASGDYIFLSDQDDEWFPSKVRVMLKALEAADFVVSDCITIDDKKNILDSSRFNTFRIKKGFWRLMIKTRYLGCCMAFRRNVLEAALPFPNNAYFVEHDLWLAAVAECYFRVRLVKEPLIYYKRHGNNASSGGNDKGFSLPVKIYRRLYRLWWIWKIRKRIE